MSTQWCYIPYSGAAVYMHGKSLLAFLCYTLWEHIHPDKERPDSVSVKDVLVIIDFQKYVVLVNIQESVCTHMSQMIEIMGDLKHFIAMYQQHSTRLDIHTLVDQLIAVTNHV